MNRPNGASRRTQPAWKAKSIRLNRPRRERRGLPINAPVVAKAVFGLLAAAVLLGLLGSGLIYGYRALTTTPALGLTEINVTGNQRLSYGQVLEIAGLSLGQNSLGVNVTRVEAALSENPWVEFVTVRRELPDKLYIRLVERQPCFWVRQEGQLYFADSEGRIITQLTPGETASLPMLEVAQDMGDKSDVLAAIVTRMNKAELPFALGQTAWLKLTDSGQVVMYLDAAHILVRADLADWQKEFDRIEAVWRDLKLRGETPYVAAIAASDGKVWVEKRNAAAS